MKKTALILLAAIFITSCNLGDNEEISTPTPQSILAEYVDITMRTLRIVYVEVDQINSKIANNADVKVDLIYGEEGNDRKIIGWEYTYTDDDSGVLVGTIKVAFAQSTAETKYQTSLIDCSKLKVRYNVYSNLQMFGSFIIYEFENASLKKGCEIDATGFGLSTTAAPEISLSGTYKFVSNVDVVGNYAQTLLSGSLSGNHSTYGSFTQNVVDDLAVGNSVPAYITSGSMILSAKNIENGAQIDVNYYSNRREVVYNNTTHITYYFNY